VFQLKINVSDGHQVLLLVFSSTMMWLITWQYFCALINHESFKLSH